MAVEFVLLQDLGNLIQPTGNRNISENSLTYLNELLRCIYTLPVSVACRFASKRKINVTCKAFMKDIIHFCRQTESVCCWYLEDGNIFGILLITVFTRKKIQANDFTSMISQFLNSRNTSRF